MTRYRHTHDADVGNAEFAEIYDAWHDQRPTRADVDDRPEPVVPKVAIEPCEDCDHIPCALQRALRRRA